MFTLKNALFNTFLFLSLSCCLGFIERTSAYEYNQDKMHFVIVADKERYKMLRKCISSIVNTNRNDLGHIAVFNLGLSENQQTELNNLEFVHVYEIELANPYIYTKFVVNNNKKKARGWYSWKPIVLKQALNMFPLMLYVDASTLVKRNLTLFFRHIRCNNYLFIDCGHDIKFMTTKPVINKFNLDRADRAHILLDYGLEAGFQGLSRAVYKDYICPIYELAKDITNFEDDGTAPDGFGCFRHDQTYFSIKARLLNLEIKSRRKFELFISGRPVEIKFAEYIGLKALKGQNLKKLGSDTQDYN